MMISNEGFLISRNARDKVCQIKLIFDIKCKSFIFGFELQINYFGVRMEQELNNYEAKQVRQKSKEIMVIIADQLNTPKPYIQLVQEKEEAVVKAQLIPKQDISFYGKHKIKILACLSLLMTIIMVILYFDFKEHCPFQSQFECVLQYIYPSLKSWVQKITVICILGVIQFHFLVHGTTYRLVPLGGIVLMGCLLFFSDQTISRFYYIGAINLAHVIMYAFFLIVYSILMTFVFCFRKKKILFYATNGLILIASLLFYVFVIRQSCGYWEKGINGKIQKIDGLCNIKTPSICWYNVINGKIPPSLISNECFIGQGGKKYFNKFFKAAKAQGDFIAFPNINSFKEPELYDQAIQQYVTKYAKGYKTREEAKSSPEKPDVVFDSENQIYHIDVQKNQTLIKERAEVWQKSQLSDSPPLAKNVLFLFTDSIGRQSMHLKLPKVVKWFQKQAVKESYFTDQVPDTTNNNLNPNGSKGEAYEFYRYNSLMPLTQPNLLAMFSGYRLQKQMYPGKMVPSVVKDFKSRGYITGSGNTICSVNSVSTSVAFNNSFQSSHYDHNSMSFACDPNFQDLSSTYTYSKGYSMSGRRCLYGKDLYEYASEYALSFFQKYKDQPKLFSMHFLEGHEVTGDGANTLNEPISNILDKLDSGGYLDDTLVILISDHGMHIFMVGLGTENFYTERNLPGLMMRLPQKMNKKYRNTIRKNQQYIVTSKNMHHFLKQIALGDKYEGKKQSILEDLTENKSCDKVGIYQPLYCSCK